MIKKMAIIVFSILAITYYGLSVYLIIKRHYPVIDSIYIQETQRTADRFALKLYKEGYLQAYTDMGHNILNKEILVKEEQLIKKWDLIILKYDLDVEEGKEK